MDRNTILVVDDERVNINVLVELLRDDYQVLVAKDGDQALKRANGDQPPDLILLDVMMPGIDGYEVCRRLKHTPETADIPVIFITAMGEVENESHGLELGAVDYITKPISPAVVKARVRTHLSLRQARNELKDQNRKLEVKVAERTEELRHINEELLNTRLEIIRRLGRASEYKDNETGLHVIRMSHYSRILAAAYGMPAEQVEMLFQAAPMHDIGKIGIPDRILLKPGKLDDDEWRLMRKHPEIGAGIIGDQDSPLLTVARSIALTHHEKWNGQGYPHGLKGEDIPIEGRICAVADVFDALTTARPYKAAWPVERAVKLLEEEAGDHFDPSLVPLFINNLDAILAIRDKWAEKESVLEDPVQ
ncbi:MULTISPECIES: two-component system response regulator [unclassified Roseibium]|jgi:putative two-component system response regulator|uniref:response regulator n=1 Tax=unclassified Roseibium TaxID=2629323 RepID=UPI00273D08E9|nr:MULTISPECIES: two-component system response regulator [unclassified Roseibium]